MKCFAAVFLFVLGLFVNCAAYACWEPAPPFYSAPDYIDPGYTQQPTHQFMLLMHDYADAVAVESRDPYAAARQERIGRESEAARKKALADGEALANLLKAKDVRLDRETFEKAVFSECPNNSVANALAFVRAVVGDPAVTAGAAELARARFNLLLLCASGDGSAEGIKRRQQLLAALSDGVATLQQTKGTGAYSDYLAALLSLYGSEQEAAYWRGGPAFVPEGLPKALELMRKVQKEALPKSIWLHQTATYLVARLQLIMAQKDWDGQTTPVKADAALLKGAKEGYADYLRQYPSGLYADSARNIRRKILFLENDRAELNRELEARINEAFARSHFTKDEFDAAYDVFTEFKIRYDGEAGLSRLTPLAAFYILLRNETVPPDSFNVFQRREGDFKNWPGLFRLTRAYVLFSQKDYAKLLELTPFEPVTRSVVSRSVEALRARAFEAVGKKDEAVRAWQNIARAAPDAQAQIHIAGLYAGMGDFEKIFAKDSGVSDPHVAGDFALFAADDNQLWKVLEKSSLEPDSREMIQKALFRRLLLKRDYKRIQRLIQKYPRAEDAKEIAGDLSALAENPNSAGARVNVADYIYESYLRPDAPVYDQYKFLYSADILDELKAVCPTCKPVEGAVSPFADFYEAEQAFAAKKERSEVEAETLHHLIKCFRGSEFSDRCRWGREEKAQNRGKFWFKRLHSLYPESKWTQETPYYY
ncbi:MAG: hypothetical protein PHW76_05020 [Alphaproteobacteria bacterium]|nr:hypothetical protein [Alphaproteobacteria bacterium]